MAPRYKHGEPSAVLSARVPESVSIALRDKARQTGRSLSDVVTEKLCEPVAAAETVSVFE
jgi:predicted HicB family RNase H-like nuclease